MRKENEIWTLVTPICHEALFNIAKDRKISGTKIVLNIVYNKLPESLGDDYTFSTDRAKKIVLKLNDKEYEHITNLARNENAKPSKFLRMVIYTYLKRLGYILE